MSRIGSFLWIAAWGLVTCFPVSGAPVPVPAGFSQGSEVEAVERDHAFVELIAPHDSWFVGEQVTVFIRFGFDTDFFEKHAIQLFQTRFDVPIQLQVRWWDEFPYDAPPVEEPVADEGDSAGMTCTLNQHVVRAKRIEDRLIHDRHYTVLEVERTIVPEKAGELTLSEPVLRYAHASSFQETLLSGRVAQDRTDVAVPGEPLRLTVMPLPEKARPDHFSGAVGRFEVHADVSPTEVVLGESLRLTLTVRGAGNLSQIEPPDLERQLEGFDIFGMIEGDSEKESRTFCYDLLPLDSSIEEIPAIAFSFFETQPEARYCTVDTAPLPIRIIVPEEQSPDTLLVQPESRTPIPGRNDIYDIKPAAMAREESPDVSVSMFLLAAVFLIPWPIAAGLYLWLRARERARNDPAGIRARNAYASYQAAVEIPDRDISQVFIEYLSARMRCAPGAVVSPNLAERMTSLGVPESDARESADLIDSLVSAHYGRISIDEDFDAMRRIVERLESHFKQEDDPGENAGKNIRKKGEEA